MRRERGKVSLARRLIDETVHRHHLDPKALTIHSDGGVPAAKPVFQLLATLEITRSVTRETENPERQSVLPGTFRSWPPGTATAAQVVYINPPQEVIGTHEFPNPTVSPGLTGPESIGSTCSAVGSTDA